MYYFDIARLYTPSMCIYLHFTYNIAAISIPFSFATYTVYRFCFIIYYTKPFFKTKLWVFICISGEWVAVCLTSLPFVLRNGPYCGQPFWLRIYTCVLAVCLPVLINTSLNIIIFAHVRASTRRIQPQTSVSNATTGNQNRQPKINRREIALLKQMIFMCTIFIISWTPTFSIVIFVHLGYPYLNIFYCLVVWGEFIIVFIILNLFKCNHELVEYYRNIVRQYVFRA
ncbi:hypothetical protein I4U23_001412 [Adineta vaga]|nr:hypothetical protein I4U23_001412 [Adineta vaga]